MSIARFAQTSADRSKELQHLDECRKRYRNTYRALRDSKKILHARFIAYLRSSHNINVSLGSILKHEEALAKVDQSIDEWLGKIEDVDTRRNIASQRLVEHTAAVLALGSSGIGADTLQASIEQTTSKSNEQEETIQNENYEDTESIQVYAGSEVHVYSRRLSNSLKRLRSQKPARSTCELCQHEYMRLCALTELPHPGTAGYNMFRVRDCDVDLRDGLRIHDKDGG